MRYYTIGIIGLMLILLTLVITPASAKELNVLSEQQSSLWQGQTSQVYEINLNCPGTATVISSSGARVDLYAQKKMRSGTCPSGNSIRYNYDKVAYGNSGSASMTLSSGSWCLMVYGRSGSGSYTLRIVSSCSYPTPYPTVYPTPYPTQPAPCGVYKTDTQTGFLNQAQANVIGYYIPTDGRSKIEWYMTTSGSCGGDTPIIVASEGNPSVDSSSCSGYSIFDLFVFKDCNPKNSKCNTNYYSYGPNSYVSIANPTPGSTYYVMANARRGSGTYSLKMNSYKCTSGDTPIIVAAAPDVLASVETGYESAGTGTGADTASSTSVTAPTAEFVPPSSQ